MNTAYSTNERKKSTRVDHATTGTYGLGLIGALVYFIQSATSFWDGALGILQAIFWPAFLVYEALKNLGA
jgi:hypothetical protein